MKRIIFTTMLIFISLIIVGCEKEKEPIIIASTITITNWEDGNSIEVKDNNNQITDILKNANYTNMTCDCIQNYEITLENGDKYILYSDNNRVRIGSKEAYISDENIDLILGIIN